MTKPKLILSINYLETERLDFDIRESFLDELFKTVFGIPECIDTTFKLDGSDEDDIAAFHQGLGVNTSALLIEISENETCFVCYILGLDANGQAFIFQFSFTDKTSLVEGLIGESAEFSMKMIEGDYFSADCKSIISYIEHMNIVNATVYN